MRTLPHQSRHLTFGAFATATATFAAIRLQLHAIIAVEGASYTTKLRDEFIGNHHDYHLVKRLHVLVYHTLKQYRQEDLCKGRLHSLVSFLYHTELIKEQAGAH